MLTLRSIFLYLDRTHAISTAGVKSLFEMGLQLFRKHLAEHPKVLTGSLSWHSMWRHTCPGPMRLRLQWR